MKKVKVNTGYDKDSIATKAEAEALLTSMAAPHGISVEKVTYGGGQYHATVAVPGREALKAYLIAMEVDQGAWGSNDEDVEEYLDDLGF
jgi:hypothetical protein